MPSALVGRASCARCAAPAPADLARCPRCGVPLEPAAPGSALIRSGPLVGVSAARGRRGVAVGVDLAIVVVGAVGGAAVTEAAAAALGRDAELAAITAVVVALLALAAIAAVLRASGRSPGRRLLGLRTVDTVTGLPPRGAGTAVVAVVTGRGRTLVTADLRLGRDPAIPQLRPPIVRDGADHAATTPRVRAAPEPVDAAGARLVLDSGDELVVVGPMLLGRAPEPRAGVRSVHPLPDLSRGLARTHLLVDWSNGLVWVTDLGSPGGSQIEPETGAAQPLVPGVRTAVAAGWRVRIGGRVFTVRSLGVTEVRGG